MGADIHIYSETRKDGQWLADKAPTYKAEKESEDYTYHSMEESAGKNRDYWYFGLLAEVRTEWPFSCKPKGLPDDPSEQVGLIAQAWEGDAHSASWLTRAELIAKRNELHHLRGENLINPSQEYDSRHLDHLIGKLEEEIQYLRELSPDASDEDQRIVFWFDN